MLVFFTNIGLMEFQVRYLTLLLLFSVIGGLESVIVCMRSFLRNIQLMLEFLRAPILDLHFSYYTSMTFLMMLSVILLPMLIILLSIIRVIRHLSVATTWIGFWIWMWSTRHCRLRQEMACWFQCWENQSNNNVSIEVKMDESVLKEKSAFKMLELTFSSKLDWGSYIISIAKTVSKKIGALIHSMKFLSPEFPMYPYKSTICPCMEYCCHV